MTTEYAKKSQFPARAFLLGERIDVRALSDVERIGTMPLTVRIDGGGFAVLFRYGAVVFFDVSAADEGAFLDRLAPLVDQPYTSPEAEELTIRIDPNASEKIEAEVVSLHDPGVERLQLVAEVLGKSLVLAMYETQVADHFDRIEPFAVELHERRRVGRKAGGLLRHIGGTLVSEHKMVGRVHIDEKPDLLWEHPELERLYSRLEDEFDIRERHAALERKFSLIARTAETVLRVWQDRHLLRVEWYIVVLILVSILLSLYGMFVGGK